MITLRIRTRALAGWCYRMGTSLAAGIDIRRCLDREVERAGSFRRRQMAAIRDRVAQGHSLSDAMEAEGRFFPDLVRPLLRAGELSGGLDRILLMMANYYETILSARRQLLRAAAWPLIELFLTLMIIGLLIWIPVILPRNPETGQPHDMLGWGLVGYTGLVRYVTFLVVVAIAILATLESIVSRRFGAHHIVTVLEHIPFLGSPFTDLALGRVAWSLGLTTATAMNLTESLELALRASHLPRFDRLVEPVKTEIMAGRQVHEILRETRQFPPEFVDTIEVGEESGELAESMARLSRQYEERAHAAVHRLAVIGGFLIWVLIAILIISLVFHLYGNYISMIQGLT